MMSKIVECNRFHETQYGNGSKLRTVVRFFYFVKYITKLLLLVKDFTNLNVSNLCPYHKLCESFHNDTLGSVVYVCTCVCMRACVRVRAHVCTCVHMCISPYTGKTEKFVKKLIKKFFKKTLAFCFEMP